MQPPKINKWRIHSGQQSAPIVHAGEHASIGEGDDGSLWILLHDPERRPRGRDPGVVIESDSVSFEQNGLVRVLDRRLSPDTIERLVADLTGLGSSVADSLSAYSRIPDGDYAGIVVESVDGHYRVHAHGPAARRFAGMQTLGTNSWLVLAGEESKLRRELVHQLMPSSDRIAWATIKNGSLVLLSSSALIALLALLEPRLLPLAAACLVALGLFHSSRKSIIGRARQRWVEPCVSRTVLQPLQASNTEASLIAS